MRTKLCVVAGMAAAFALPMSVAVASPVQASPVAEVGTAAGVGDSRPDFVPADDPKEDDESDLADSPVEVSGAF